MKSRTVASMTAWCLLIAGLAASQGCTASGPPPAASTAPAFVPVVQPSAPPPATPIRPVTEEFFGTKVVDPYRHLENLKDPEVESWFKAQDDYARGILARIPGRDGLLGRIKQLDAAKSAHVSDVRRLPGSRFFYQKRGPSEDMPKLYVRDGLAGQEKLLVDPETFAKPGASKYAINYYAPSLDGQYVVVGVSPAGSEDAVLRVVDTTTGKETGDVIDRAQFGSPAWLPGGRSFAYNRLQKLGPKSAPTDRYLKSRVYLHVLGRDPDKDPLVFGYDASPAVRVDPTDIPFIEAVRGTTWIIGIIAHGVRNEITAYVAPATSIGRLPVPWKKVCDVDDAVTGLAARGDDLFLLSHKDASRFKVLRTALSKPDIAAAELIVPPGEPVLRDLAAASDALYVQALDGGIGRLLRIPYGSKAEMVPLPFNGTVDLSATDQRVPGTLLAMTSWTKAVAIYAYDPQSKQTTDTGLQPIGPNDAPADLESVEVKAKSHDGTMVPLSITYRKGLKRDGSNPALLLGYGSYGITEDPAFDPLLLAWYELGGIFAVAHVRGGGEYGEDWHLAGKGLTKPNTWKDFIACGQYLIDQKYTDAARLGGLGGSAGGITIGRSITERPDLFAAVIDAVPASDLLRMELTPNGPPNVPEFGTVKTEEGFKGLHAMSAYQHVADHTPYPAVLVTTGWNDPRVISWEPGKVAARLQGATSSGKPVLLRVDYEAGHGIGSSNTLHLQELADEMSFLLWQFGAPRFQPPRQ
jgi:prolyl oligopeptidase